MSFWFENIVILIIWVYNWIYKTRTWEVFAYKNRHIYLYVKSSTVLTLLILALEQLFSWLFRSGSLEVSRSVSPFFQKKNKLASEKNICNLLSSEGKMYFVAFY